MICHEQTGILQHISLLFHHVNYLLDCSDGDIRLVGGTSSSTGRVEICYSGVWGTVCDDLWGRADAAVACRQLGFSSSGAVARTSAAFGQGSGPILFEDLKCTGLEYRVFDCPSRGIEVTTCSHSEDAGVECMTGKA